MEEKSMLDNAVIKKIKEDLKKQALEDALLKDPTVEELSLEEAIDDIKGEMPKKIVLKPGFQLKRCTICGYMRPMDKKQLLCANFACKEKTLEVLNVDEYYEESIEKYKERIATLPTLLDWKE